MTSAARGVLKDCELALEDFEAGAATQYWRSRFVGLVTGLRAVGMVLNLTDRPVADEKLKQAIDDAWKTLNASKPEPKIFHDFIDAERYNVAHLYSVRAAVNITLRPGTLWANVSSGESGILADGGPTTYDYFMRSGPFKGQDPITLCRDAIVFWKDYLDGIEKAAT